VKKYRFRLLMIIAFIALSVYYLQYTYRDAMFQQDVKGLTGLDSLNYVQDNDESMRSARENRIKLGLDLQGGMYVTLEVNVAQMLEKMAKNKDERLREILLESNAEAEESDEPYLDIFVRKFEERAIRMSRYYGDIRNTNDEVMTMLREETAKAVDRAEEIINNRVNQYGVSESSIQRSGARRIIVELPGVSDEREVRGLIQETAQLEFKTFVDPKITLEKMELIDKLLLGEGIDPTETPVDTTQAALADVEETTTVADTETAEESPALAETTEDSAQLRLDSIREASMTDDQKIEKFRAEHPFQALFAFSEQGIFASESNRERIANILKRYDVQSILNEEVAFAWGNEPIDSEGEVFFPMYSLKARAEMTGEVISNAVAQMDPQGLKGAIVSMQMDNDGAREWASITGDNVNKPIAIVLDDVVFSAPVVQQKIIGGNSQIEGMKDMKEARLLEIVLKAGALPAPVDIIEERTVGPSLGEDSIQKGLYSFLVGIGIVMIFMLIYYSTAGIAANMALTFNMIFILGVLAGFHATLTLPGIAGLLLTVGMAVDANVLINERIREESAMGKTLRAAIDAGYSRAFPAIIDSNITTLITCIILYQFGSGPIKGFALTLMIGIVCSLFTAIIMTRVYFEFFTDKKPEFIKFG
jgi:SecD/SecF fusion protein